LAGGRRGRRRKPADVAATMLSVTHACGLRGVDVTFTALSASQQASFDEPALILMR